MPIELDQAIVKVWSRLIAEKCTPEYPADLPMPQQVRGRGVSDQELFSFPSGLYCQAGDAKGNFYFPEMRESAIDQIHAIASRPYIEQYEV